MCGGTCIWTLQEKKSIYNKNEEISITITKITKLENNNNLI